MPPSCVFTQTRPITDGTLCTHQLVITAYNQFIYQIVVLLLLLLLLIYFIGLHDDKYGYLYLASYNVSEPTARAWRYVLRDVDIWLLKVK